MNHKATALLLTLFLALPPVLGAQEDVHGQDQIPGVDSGHPSEVQDSAQVGGAEVFLGAFRAIRNYHQEAYGDSVLWKKALEGLVQELDDPYATVFDPEEFDDFQENNTGNYAGIGVTITQLNDQITVTAVFRGTPADQAGLQVGDQIVEVDGEDAREWSVQQASERIRGPVGSTVEVGVNREGLPETMPFTIERDEVHVPAVTAETVQDSIGYLLIDRVARNSAQEVDSALTVLEGSKGLIVDLRRNPGGYLEEALNIADLFLEPGQVVASARSRVPGGDGESREETWKAQSPAWIQEMPIVILVDEYTASASEIVTGALQDHDRALVLGERTFGKGVVQTVMRIPGERRIRLTTGSWYTPLGRSLHRPRDGQGRPVPENADTLPSVSTDAGRELRAGGGIFPDLAVADDTLSTVEQEFMTAVGQAGIPLGVRIAEAGFERAQALEETPGSPLLLPDSILSRFVASLEDEGLSAELADDPQVRDYLDWRIRGQVAERLERANRALEIRMERDRVLAEAVELLRSADTQTDLFAAADRRNGSDDAGTETATAEPDSAANDGPEGDGGG